MALTPTEEQVALAETIRTLLRKTEPQDAWPLLCEQVGVPGLAVPESYGGAGAGPAELAVAALETGRELTVAPLLGSTVLATHALLESADESACERLLPPIAEGRSVAALAWTSAEGRWDPDTAACTADGGVLEGTAHFVLDGDTADVLLVVARAGDELALFEVEPAGQGVSRRHTPTMDASRRLAEVRLTRAAGRRIGTGDFRPALHRVRDLACAMLAAEQAGAAERALEITVAYTKEREQFGRPIGGFQALKHRMADMYVLVETARSAALAAATFAEDRERLSAVAKVHCSRALSTVAAEMIQLHGGIGITWEHPAHRYFKRAHSSEQLLGRPHEHLARVTARP